MDTGWVNLHGNMTTDYEELGESDWILLQARVFGELVKLVQPVLIAYQGDLFHDATRVRDLISAAGMPDGEATFFYSFDQCGTQLVNDEVNMVREHRYRVSVAVRVPDSGVYPRWMFRIVGA